MFHASNPRRIPSPKMAVALPIELLQLIFNNVPQNSLRNCRLVDHQWSAASAPLVFDRFHASLFSRSLTKLAALCQSPLAKHVKAIDFHTDQLPDYTRPQWEKKIDMRPPVTSFMDSRVAGEGGLSRLQAAQMYQDAPKHFFDPEELEAGWQAYRALFDEQNRWSEEEGRTLKTCFANLPNVREVIVDRAKPFERSRIDDKKYWSNLKSVMLVGPVAWHYEMTSTQGRFDCLSTFLLIDAIGHRNGVANHKPVETLAIELPSTYSWLDMASLKNNYPFREHMGSRDGIADPGDRYEAIIKAFEPLITLNLLCPSFVEDSDWSRPERAQIVETFMVLHAATEVQSLELEFGEAFRDGAGYDHTAGIPVDQSLLPLLLREKATYPHLREFQIGGSFPPAPFINFLALHKSTLKRLDIRDSLSYNWDSILTFIAKELDLEDIYVESLWVNERADQDMDQDDPMDSSARLLIGEGLDDGSEFAHCMREWLLTGEGEIPREADFESDESDEDESMNEEAFTDDDINEEEMAEWEASHNLMNGHSMLVEPEDS